MHQSMNGTALDNIGIGLIDEYPCSHEEMMYRLVCSYELSNVAVVNVSERDFVTATNVFKIIAFPDIRLFKAESSRLKVISNENIAI